MEQIMTTNPKNHTSTKEVIFLTGCINPAGMTFTVLQDPKIRQQQYTDAIRYYVKATDLPILFVENSGTDISPVFNQEIRSGRLEVITFDGNNYDKNLGKGYGEMLIIERALEVSRLLKDADFVFKITGRYKLLNLKSFVQQYRENRKLEVLVDLKHQLQYSDSRIWGSSVSFLREILVKYKNQINDSENFYFEHALCYATHEAILKKYAFVGFRNLPRFDGTYATSNKRYRSSLLFWLPQNLKQFIKYKALHY
jgi:hypothetical protein